MLAVTGDCVSSKFTALAVVQVLLSQTRETSSSVGPIPVGLDGDSDRGMQPAPSRIVAGEVVTEPLAVIRGEREESTGLWQHLAEITIKVESRRPRDLRASTILPIEASANWISLSKEAVGMPWAST